MDEKELNDCEDKQKHLLLHGGTEQSSDKAALWVLRRRCGSVWRLSVMITVQAFYILQLWFTPFTSSGPGFISGKLSSESSVCVCLFTEIVKRHFNLFFFFFFYINWTYLFICVKQFELFCCRKSDLWIKLNLNDEIRLGWWYSVGSVWMDKRWSQLSIKGHALFMQNLSIWCQKIVVKYKKISFCTVVMVTGLS